MNELKGFVSIVIPAYNAGNFINETISSIINQTCTNWEVWVINDGSTDDTGKKVNAIKDTRISLVNQENSGVSVARNKGLELSQGEYIVFFDADDIMTPDFLEVRINELDHNKDIDFVGGWVENFPVKEPGHRPVAENPEREIHFFDPSVVTIPSNYLFRTSAIKENKVSFNPLLSNSADRFFLLEIATHSKGKSLDNEKGKLLYRVSESSMSHHLTPKLVLDYRQFYDQLNLKNMLPAKKRREIKSRYLFSLASGFSLIRYWGSCARLFFLSFFTHPLVFFQLLGNKIGKLISKK